jgi:hypothetical protein
MTVFSVSMTVLAVLDELVSCSETISWKIRFCQFSSLFAVFIAICIAVAIKNGMYSMQTNGMYSVQTEFSYNHCANELTKFIKNKKLIDVLLILLHPLI